MVEVIGMAFFLALGAILFVLALVNKLGIIPILDASWVIRVFGVLFIVFLIPLTYTECNENRAIQKVEKAEAREIKKDQDRILGYWQDAKGNCISVTENEIAGLYSDIKAPEVTVKYEVLTPGMIKLYEPNNTSNVALSVCKYSFSEDGKSMRISHDGGSYVPSSDYTKTTKKDYESNLAATMSANATNPIKRYIVGPDRKLELIDGTWTGIKNNTRLTICESINSPSDHNMYIDDMEDSYVLMESDYRYTLTIREDDYFAVFAYDFFNNGDYMQFKTLTSDGNLPGGLILDGIYARMNGEVSVDGNFSFPKSTIDAEKLVKTPKDAELLVEQYIKDSGGEYDEGYYHTLKQTDLGYEIGCYYNYNGEHYYGCYASFFVDAKTGEVHVLQ